MKLIIDEDVYKHQQIFANFGNIKILPAARINNTEIKNYDVLIVRSRVKINECLLQGSSIKFVGSTVSGVDHVDQDYLAANNIKFFASSGCNANAVAEFVIAACVNIAHDFNFDLTKKTLAIIGVGNIGSKLNIKAKLMGINTILNDPPRQQKEGATNFSSLKTALNADMISVHTPLTFTGTYPSYKLISNNNFHHIKKNSIIFNVARGGIIDESVWQKNKTLINVIDCWEDEPNINKILKKNSYWATPHIAGHSIDAKLKGGFMAYEALCDYFNIKKELKLTNFINLQNITINKTNIRDTINKIYLFFKDSEAIKNNINFENYRKNYPKRYEWHHFKTKISLPIT